MEQQTIGERAVEGFGGYLGVYRGREIVVEVDVMILRTRQKGVAGRRMGCAMDGSNGIFSLQRAKSQARKDVLLIISTVNFSNLKLNMARAWVSAVLHWARPTFPGVFPRKDN